MLLAGSIWLRYDVITYLRVKCTAPVAARGEIGREGCEISSLVAGPSPRFSSRGAKNQMEGQKNRSGATFLKYSIGCMQQPGGQTWNGGAQSSNGGTGHHWSPAGDGHVVEYQVWPPFWPPPKVVIQRSAPVAAPHHHAAEHSNARWCKWVQNECFGTERCRWSATPCDERLKCSD